MSTGAYGACVSSSTRGAAWRDVAVSGQSTSIALNQSQSIGRSSTGLGSVLMSEPEFFPNLIDELGEYLATGQAAD